MTKPERTPTAWLKRTMKRMLSPWKVSMGAGSFIRRPFRVSSATQISLGNNVTILGHVTLAPIRSYAGMPHDPHIVICDGVYVGRYVAMHAIDWIEIGAGCVLSDFIYLSDSSHGFDPDAGPIMEQPLASKGPIRLGKHCFIGQRAVILSGVTLGDHCIVGASSVVTHSFPAYSVIGGVPARLIRTAAPGGSNA